MPKSSFMQEVNTKEFIELVLKRKGLKKIDLARRLRTTNQNIQMLLRKKTKSGTGINNLVDVMESVGEELVVRFQNENYKIVK